MHGLVCYQEFQFQFLAILELCIFQGLFLCLVQKSLLGLLFPYLIWEIFCMVNFFIAFDWSLVSTGKN